MCYNDKNCLFRVHIMNMKLTENKLNNDRISAAFFNSPGFKQSLEKQSLKNVANKICASLLVYIAFMRFIPIVANNASYLIFGKSVSMLGYDYVLMLNIFTCIISYMLSILFILATTRQPILNLVPVDKAKISFYFEGTGVLLGLSVIGAVSSGIITVLLKDVGISVNNTIATPSLTPFAIVSYFIIYAFLPAFFEEIMFRGIILNLLKKYSNGFAVFTSSILFALLHQNISQIPFAFISGAALALFAMRTNSIVVPMVMHFINNCFAVALSLIRIYCSDTYITVIFLSVYAIYLILGILGAANLVKKTESTFGITRTKSLLTTRLKYKYAIFSEWGTVYVVIAAVLIIMNLYN